MMLSSLTFYTHTSDQESSEIDSNPNNSNYYFTACLPDPEKQREKVEAHNAYLEKEIAKQECEAKKLGYSCAAALNQKLYEQRIAEENKQFCTTAKKLPACLDSSHHQDFIENRSYHRFKSITEIGAEMKAEDLKIEKWNHHLCHTVLEELKKLNPAVKLIHQEQKEKFMKRCNEIAKITWGYKK